MTTSEILSRLARLGFSYDNERSTPGNRIFWYSWDGHSANEISFASFSSALRFAEER